MQYYINKQGNAVTSPEYSWACRFHNGIACVHIPSKGVCFIDKEGQIKIRLPGFQEDPTGYFYDRAVIQNKRFFGYADIKGGIAVQTLYLGAQPFSQGLGCVQTKKGFTFIDPNGAFLCDQYYKRLQPFREGLALGLIEGKWFFINEQFEQVLGPYTKAENFNEGVAYAEIGEKRFYIDPSSTV